MEREREAADGEERDEGESEKEVEERTVRDAEGLLRWERGLRPYSTYKGPSGRRGRDNA